MRSGGIQLRVSDLLFALQKKWKLIISLSLLGLVFGLLLTAMTYVQDSAQYYRIRGSVVFQTVTSRGTYLGNSAVAQANDYRMAIEMIDGVTYVIRSDRLIHEVIDELQILGTSVSSIRNNLSVSQTSSTPILTMTLEWSDPQTGLDIWNAVFKKANEMIPQMLMIGKLELINEPTASQLSSGGGSATMPMLLAVLGFAAGAGYAVLELLMHPTLTNVKDIETVFDLETMGLIPMDSDYFRKSNSILVQDDAASSEVAQNFAAAAYILRNRLGTKEENHCFYITSAVNREGRSVVAANLAIQLSDMEHHTLLVDFDTHNPSLGTLFMSEVDYNRSLNALYRGEINQTEAITTLTGYLDILPMVLEHKNLISMDGVIVDLINKLKEKYEYVIIDAPPVGRESDTLSLNQVASTVLFVIGYDQSTIPEIQSSLDKLDKSGIRVLGCIVNRVQSSRFSLSGEDAQTKRKKRKEKLVKKVIKKKQGFFSGSGKDEENSKNVDELLDIYKDTESEKEKKKERAKKQGKEKKAKSVTAALAQETPRKQPPAYTSAAFGSARRNVFEDLMEQEEAGGDGEPLTSQDIADELLKMKADKGWNEDGHPSSSQDQEN